MKNFPALLLLILAFTVLYSCQKKPGGSKVPQIDLVGISVDSIQSGNPNQHIVIQFYLKDGDGDLGIDPDNGTNYDIYIKDARIDTFVGYFFPTIGDEVKDSDKGVEGNAYFDLRGDFIFVRDDSLHMAAGDTTQMELYIRDIAGNESNHITTPTIYIRP